ncbi:odorant receptor 63a-like [Anopheles funestus]|uniref:odorant receptor 63a-like n=1 Tax=Anopheles funestus TaxID=62324 RepID=UPI0020C66606|nr:odorant receptor 63a-like [Anopheles funestus]
MDTNHYQPEDDFIELVQRSSYWLRTMATTMGVWPGQYVTIRNQWYRRLYYFMLLMHWLNIYLQTEFFFRNLGNLSLVVQGLCSFVSITTTGIKVMRLHAYEEEIKQLWQALEDATFLKKIRFLRKTDRGTVFAHIHKLLLGQWKEVQLNLRFYTLVVGLVASNYSIIPACSNLYNQFQGNAYNRSFGTIVIFSLKKSSITVKLFCFDIVYNTYYPFLEPIKRRSPLFELLFCSESLSGYTTWAGVVAFDGLYVVMVLYAASLMRLLRDLMHETANPDLTHTERAFFQRECILHHIRTMQLSSLFLTFLTRWRSVANRCLCSCRLIERINEIFSPVLLVQLFTSTSIICVIAFAASMHADEGDSQTMLMVLYLIAAIYQLFQFCWYGQRLQNESTELPLSVYDVQWELCAERFKSTHHILLLYSQRQIDMRAWSFSAMSLETFSTIIRSAASYFTVLQTLAEE